MPLNWKPKTTQGKRRLKRQMNECFVGIDTSNYTTSAAVCSVGGEIICNFKMPLFVDAGERGLRQRDAVFAHVKNLPEICSRLRGVLRGTKILSVGCSSKPRDAEDSYMPCFLVGSSQGQSLSAALGVPFYAFSHQQGHIAAAAWSAGRLDLLSKPFLAWHLSGGTTELLLVTPNADGVTVDEQILGGTQDISAGQLIDRTGVLLGCAFPAGKAIDALSQQATQKSKFKVKLHELTFSLSGMENKVKEMAARGEAPENMAWFVLDTISDVVLRATQEALIRYPNLEILCSGGVASNSHLRGEFAKLGAVFAKPEFSMDNAMGIAILTHRAAKKDGIL